MQKNIPCQVNKFVKTNDFDYDSKKANLGILYLLPKILKLKTIGPESISVLKCRGIKSSMNDPIQCVQKVLDHIFNHLLYHIEEQFHKDFQRLSPSCTSVNEAIERLKSAKVNSWGGSVAMDSDFTDLYSNCNIKLLKKYVKIGSDIAELSPKTIEFINNLIDVNMTKSYFKEPNGIFKTLAGFSMGDIAASRGSEVILRGAELEIFRKLKQKNLLKNVVIYLRFKDDIFVIVNGSNEEMTNSLEIIATGYPDDIQLNAKVNIINGKF